MQSKTILSILLIALTSTTFAIPTSGKKAIGQKGAATNDALSQIPPELIAQAKANPAAATELIKRNPDVLTRLNMTPAQFQAALLS